MNRIEHYHDWLRDAHAMEKQAEKMLESMANRIENYPELRSRIEQHISETKNQLSQLESILLQYPLLKQFLMKKNKWLNGFLTIFLTPLSNSWSDLKLMELKPKNNSFEEALCLDT